MDSEETPKTSETGTRPSGAGEPTYSHAVGLEVVEPEERTGVVEAPVSVGLVFPKGRVREFSDGSLTPMRLVDGHHASVAFTARATGWWGPSGVKERDVKWILIHFRARSGQSYRLLVDPSPETPPSSPLTPIAAKSGDQILIDTGLIRAVLSTDTPNLFQSVTVGEAPGFGPTGEPKLVAHDGTKDVPTTLTHWMLTLEENTGLAAVVKGSGLFKGTDGRDYAKLDVRLRFFRGEAFARVEPTFTWLVKPLEFGIRELSVGFKAPQKLESVRVGLSDYTDASATATPGGFKVLQSSAGAYAGSGLNGKRLGGWMEGASASGPGIGVAVRNLWQEFPKGFRADANGLTVDLWPADHGVMSFRENALIPPDYFCGWFWKAYKDSFATKNPNDDPGDPNDDWCHGHEIPGTGGKVDDPNFGANYFVHTGEGASKTHDLIVSFPRSSGSRPTAELNSLLQHPLAVRQDPDSAMNVPFLGIRLSPKSPDHPDIERAIENAARSALGRWESAHDYGFWRYGFLRWAYAQPTSAIKRWNDGVQYDQQIIPWALWMRGGDRDFYENALDTSRHAMDVSTNHFSTRPFTLNGQPVTIGGKPVPYWPSGFAKGASTTPFPGVPSMFGLTTKVHYLSLYHHLTGDERAREVMEEVINGAKIQAAIDFPAKLPRSVVRYAYNTGRFWTEAYLETWDPELLGPLQEWVSLVKTQFDSNSSQWKQPAVYVWHALLEMVRLYGDLGLDPKTAAELKGLLLKNLQVFGLPELGDGILYDEGEAAMAAGWAAEETGDRRYALLAYDLARTTADAQARFVHEPDRVPYWTQTFTGSEAWRGVIAPMLVGVSEAARLGLADEDAPWVRDVYLSVAVDNAGVGRLTAFVKPASTGDVPVSIRVANSEGPGCAVPPVTVRASLDGQEVAKAEIVMKVDDPKANPFPKRNPTQEGKLVIPEAQAGEVYAIDVEVAEPKGGHCPKPAGWPDIDYTRVRIDAGDVPLVVKHGFKDLDLTAAQEVAEKPGDVCNTATCLWAFRETRQNIVGGARLVLKTTKETISVWNPNQQPYTLRDAADGRELFRYATDSTTKLQTHKTGADRLIVLTVRQNVRGDGRIAVDGVAPVVGFAPQTWFDPEESGQ